MIVLVGAVIFVSTFQTDQGRYNQCLSGLSYLCIPSKQTKVAMIVLVGAVIFVYTMQTDQGSYDRACRGCHICVYHRNRPR